MDKHINCASCMRRPDCVKACVSLESALRREEVYFRGREILVAPTTINAIYSSRQVLPFTDMIRSEVSTHEVLQIPGLTDRQLRILKMGLVQNKSQRTIARSLGLSQSTVGEHLAAARRKARRYLEETLRRQRRKPSGENPPNAQGSRASGS
jgi:DNA-directed RNA polymerase specialized sigma24 family protein